MRCGGAKTVKDESREGEVEGDEEREGREGTERKRQWVGDRGRWCC